MDGRYATAYTGDTMATTSALSMVEYLETSYRPDREFVDGELRERNVGKWEHARLQLLIGRWLANHEADWGIVCSTEQRTQVSATRIRIPDVVAVVKGYPPDVLVEAPLLVVEILSPDDRYSDVQERASDYVRMGVGAIWLVDPQTRSARMGVGAGWVETRRLEVPGTEIYLDVAGIFEELDRTKRGA